MFHPFLSKIATQLPAKFTYPFCYTPHPLAILAAEEVKGYIATQTHWKDELKQGKMFGVLVVKNQINQLGYLAGFSGRIADSYLNSFFVPPIYDLKDSRGFFLSEENQISQLNLKVESLKREPAYIEQKRKVEALKSEYNNFLEVSRNNLAYSKRCREEKRNQGLTEEEERLLIRESQFQRAQFKREKDDWQRNLQEQQLIFDRYESEIVNLKQERKRMSAALQEKLFTRFELLNANGQIKNLREIFKEYGASIPPGGAGECAAPKLLQYAYKNGLTPICMAEFWWGDSPLGVVRKHGNFYPSCNAKCKPILSFMLQGLVVDDNPLNANISLQNRVKLIYEDDAILVFDKPEGMLSVPGKENSLSLYDYVISRWGNLSGPLIVHRLDMATSGIILVAKNKVYHQKLQEQFEKRTVEKCYVALLDGCIEQNSGEIQLPLLPDFSNRPYQLVDYEHGKPAYTTFKVLDKGGGFTKVEFYPHTGRTHQLRVHSAHSLGLNTPIKGDLLYGKPADRLYLHAQSITFNHPVSGERVTFFSPSDF